MINQHKNGLTFLERKRAKVCDGNDVALHVHMHKMHGPVETKGRVIVSPTTSDIWFLSCGARRARLSGPSAPSALLLTAPTEPT